MASTSGSPWVLFCQAIDHANNRLDDFFHVFIAPSAFISILKEEIFNRLPQDLITSFNPVKLQLWKPSIPISTRSAVIKRAFADLDFSNPESDDENPGCARELQRLNPSYKVSEYLDEEPLDKCVHIIVRIPQVDVAAKKRGLEVEDGSENEKPQKFAPAQEHDVLAACWALPPSDAAAMPAFQNEQEKRPVLNGRPLYNSGPPIGLFHPVFNSFHAAMRDPESSYADATTYPLVKALFEAFSGIYDSEDLRIAAIDKHLSPLLESRFEVVQVQGVKSDGVIAESCGPYSVHAYVAIREVKNEIGTASTDPYNQASLAYRKYWADSSRDGIRARCYCPNLILAIAGPWLCVLGGVYLQKAVIQPLTDYVWLGGDAFNADRVVFASQLFTALKSVISTLWMYYRSLDFSDATVQTEMPDPFPFIQEYESKKFTYLSRLAPEYPGKLLYKARLQVDNRFVLHRLAPPLHYAGTEHAGGQTYGGRYMVVMDFIDGNLLVDSLSKRQLERVKQAIKLLHSRDLVFGDLRLPNILVKDESVMFVDFDWCGKAGEARYPATLNNDVRLGWPMGVGPGFVMLKEHDLSMLEKLQ